MFEGMFYALLGTMFFGDLLWATLGWRRLSGTWRWAAAGFAILQFTGLTAIILGRRVWPELEESLPRWVQGAVLVWHLLLLLPWLVWQMARGLSSLAMRMAGAKKPALATGSPEAVFSRREFLTFTPPMLSLAAAGVGEMQLDGFRVRKMEVRLADLPPALEGLTIAQVSDTHVGRFTKGSVLERIVEETNRLDADVVALTGDLINDSLRALPAALEMARGLRARVAVVACEGNHDLIDDARSFYREAERGGLPLLRGESAMLTIRGQRVQLLGLPWSRNEQRIREDARALLAKREERAWAMMLAHHPHAWDACAGVPLTLSGHTHGGQLMFGGTGFGPWLYRYWSGLYVRERGALVVSNGTGNWFPVRCGAPAEIVHLTLRRA